MRRILYFSGFRMKASEWSNQTLLGCVEFEPDEAGYAEFKEYIHSAAPCPSQLLVDIIEEDFRRESIPHVTGKDQKILIDRLKDRFYRDEPHIHVERIGREKEGRKDDLILLSALTNIEPLVPWLTEIGESNLPLAGIWSVPLLSKQFLKPLNVNQKNILIVSRQVVSALRQTYFHDEKMVFSRQAKLDQSVRDSKNPEEFLKNVVTETDQTYRFLTNQRIMSFTENLNVYVILPVDQVIPVQLASFANPGESRNVKYNFLGINDIAASFKIDIPKQETADLLFSYLCAQQPLNKDHYAKKTQKESYLRYKNNKKMANASVLSTIIIAASAALLWIYSQELQIETIAIRKNTELLQQSYERTYTPIQVQLDDANTLKETTLLADRLALESKHTPHRFFNPLGQVLSQSRFSALRIDKFEWKKQQAYQLLQLRESLKRKKLVSGNNEEHYEEESYDESLPLPQPVIVLGGYFSRGNFTYSQTVSLVKQFTLALSSIPEIEEVHTVRIPVDVRTDSQFSDESGTYQDNEVNSLSDDDNVFELVLVLRGASNA